jgi:hypothetical protein
MYGDQQTDNISPIEMTVKIYRRVTEFKTCRELRSSKFRRGAKKALCRDQGCQMLCFQSKNQNLGKFWKAKE